MKDLKIIAFTHKHFSLEEVGKWVLDPAVLKEKLHALKEYMQLHELFYMATCNRVEFIFVTEQELTPAFTARFLQHFKPEFVFSGQDQVADKVVKYADEEALNHLIRVASSLDSLVVGEKEILAQVRQAYETCREFNLTGDFLRLVMGRVVKTAKEVYTHTRISEKPISVVSLAYRKLRQLAISKDSKFLLIGAGETNRHLSKYLVKHGFNRFTVFNRTFEKAAELASELKGEAFRWEELDQFNQGFDVLVTCTASTEYIITPERYTHLLQGDISRKVIIDLAIPNDVDPEVHAANRVEYIGVEQLQETAQANLRERHQEMLDAEKIVEANMAEFKPILKQRKVELAMSEVPRKIKEIRKTAVDAVFATDINQLDAHSKEVLEKVLNYIEKKYITVPMVMAKEILVRND